jgi:hypothetical protein
MSTTRGNQKRIQQQQKDMEYQEKLKLLDEELMSFYQYCQQAGFSEAEMDMIVAPLVATLRKSLMKKLVKFFGAMITIVAFCYCAAQIGSISMHLAAFGRLSMIKASRSKRFISLEISFCVLFHIYTFCGTASVV